MTVYEREDVPRDEPQRLSLLIETPEGNEVTVTVSGWEHIEEAVLSLAKAAKIDTLHSIIEHYYDDGDHCDSD